MLFAGRTLHLLVIVFACDHESHEVDEPLSIVLGVTDKSGPFCRIGQRRSLCGWMVCAGPLGSSFVQLEQSPRRWPPEHRHRSLAAPSCSRAGPSGPCPHRESRLRNAQVVGSLTTAREILRSFKSGSGLCSATRVAPAVRKPARDEHQSRSARCDGRNLRERFQISFGRGLQLVQCFDSGGVDSRSASCSIDRISALTLNHLIANLIRSG